jgi:hypothetical protein
MFAGAKFGAIIVSEKEKTMVAVSKFNENPVIVGDTSSRVHFPAATGTAFIDVIAFDVWSEFTVVTVRGSGHPRGMALVTRMVALQAEEQRREAQWHSSSVNPGRKTGTVQQSQPDGPNNNTAESMVKTRSAP